MADTIDEIGRRHGFSPAAAQAMAGALRRGGGTMAQFNHPELGGMGQWSAGGMLMIGDMFNQDLKRRVAALCNDLSGMAPTQPAGFVHERDWWPPDLGRPSSSGAQNETRYALFPDRRRLSL